MSIIPQCCTLTTEESEFITLNGKSFHLVPLFLQLFQLLIAGFWLLDCLFDFMGFSLFGFGCFFLDCFCFFDWPACKWENPTGNAIEVYPVCCVDSNPAPSAPCTVNLTVKQPKQ